MDPDSLNSPANTAWLANQATGATDITYLGNGTIIDPNGIAYIVPGESAGTTIWLQLYGWTGNSPTFNNGTLKGVTAPFAIRLTLGSQPSQTDTSSMGALVLSVPEPSLPALFALSTFGLALFRRKK